ALALGAAGRARAGTGLALVAAAFVLAGAVVGVARLRTLDRTSLKPYFGRTVKGRTILLERPRPPRASGNQASRGWRPNPGGAAGGAGAGGGAGGGRGAARRSPARFPRPWSCPPGGGQRADRRLARRTGDPRARRARPRPAGPAARRAGADRHIRPTRRRRTL